MKMHNANEFISFRKELHQHPELSGSEHKTAERITSFLKQFEPTKIIQKVGGAGVLAQFGPSKNPSVLVRCELDALPVQETNTFSHRSETEGISHKCGHDGHMTILLALAQKLYKEPIPDKCVCLLFQPAEETGEGAQAVLQDNRFKDFQFSAALALHNVPRYPLGSIVCKEGIFSSAVKSMIIQLNGSTAHAGQPETGKNPASAVAGIIQHYQELNDFSNDHFQLITPIQIDLGEEAYGVSAGHATLRFTCRTFDSQRLKTLGEELEKIVEKVAQQEKLNYHINWTQHFQANNNHPELVNNIRKVSGELNYDYIEKEEPFRWGEDFGLFTETMNGAMFGLGAGENQPALHNADYDFPDELIEPGATMFYHLLQQINS